MTSWQGYEVGKRVVCVSEMPAASWTRACPNFKKPAKGEIVTVRSQHPISETGGLGLKFEEYPDQRVFLFPFRIDIVFGAEFFRPLDDSRLDQFRKYLKDIPADLEQVPA